VPRGVPPQGSTRPLLEFRSRKRFPKHDLFEQFDEKFGGRFPKNRLFSAGAANFKSPSEGYLRVGGTIPLLEKDKAVPLEFIHSPVHLLGKH
jgi:hypothetical protein